MQAAAILYATAKIGNYFSTLGLAYTGEHPELGICSHVSCRLLTEAEFAY